jgi:hypothetical protein
VQTYYFKTFVQICTQYHSHANWQTLASDTASHAYLNYLRPRPKCQQSCRDNVPFELPCEAFQSPGPTADSLATSNLGPDATSLEKSGASQSPLSRGPTYSTPFHLFTILKYMKKDHEFPQAERCKQQLDNISHSPCYFPIYDFW